MSRFYSRGCVRIIVLTVFSLPSALAWGGLTADQTAVLANRKSPESLAVAQHYAERRGLKSDHIIMLDLTTEETISRQHYEQHVIQPLRRVLEARNLASRIKCLVTTYGIPLRVAAPQPTEEERRWAKDTADRQEKALVHLQLLEGWVKQITTSVSPEGRSPHMETERPSDTAKGPARLVNDVANAIREAVAGVGTIQDPQKAFQKRQDLAPLIQQFGGTEAMLQVLQPMASANSEQSRQQMEEYRQKIATAERLIWVLSAVPSDMNRQRAYRLAQQVFGLRGILTLAQDESERFSYQNGDASLDSELVLLWWDPGDYRVAGRMPNPLFQSQGATSPLRIIPIVMVARLDAPTAELARRLVDQALAAEQHGLAGKFYLDAQGLKPDASPGYGFYDQSLRESAALVRRSTSYEVRLEDTPQRFSQPGAAPDVALYIGWYRLRSYENAFSFNPGAIGYHIASGEAVSLHDPDEPGWCKNALQHGITATLGSTGEPFLDSFPLPKDFIALLLTGRYTLVEAYYLTTRYVSWRMLLVGDPMYNPWRDKGTTAHADPAPTPPGDLKFPDPVKAREQYRSQMQTTLAQAERSMELLGLDGGRP
jgi:uncharacterized protein (TIGR03790 family)